MKRESILLVFLWYSVICKCEILTGPDPWNYESVQIPDKLNDNDLPPDLKTPITKGRQSESKFGFGEWWFKRLLAIMLKSGQIKKSEDGSVDISLQMRFDEERWEVLEECLKSDTTLSDGMFRRTIGYVEESVYKPTITDQIVMAWSDYIHVYLMEYKMYFTLLLGAFGGVGILFWLWRHMSHRHVLMIIFAMLYIYEVIISYKEAEQQEYDKFVSAVNTCKWYFWTTECTIPPPDPLIFMKHMNPLKIGIRMFTALISEPIIVLNSTIRITIQGVTDGLWFPFDKIVCGLIILVINISLIYLLVMVVFNFIFNISFSLNFLHIVSVGVERSRTSMFSTTTTEQQSLPRDTDRISGDRLDRLLNVCSLALTNVTKAQYKTNTNALLTNNNEKYPKLKRSASTGRLPTGLENNNDQVSMVNTNFRKRQNLACGDGDYIK